MSDNEMIIRTFNSSLHSYAHESVARDQKSKMFFEITFTEAVIFPQRIAQ